MGQRASDTRGITFEDVVVPKEVSYILLFTVQYIVKPLWRVSLDLRQGCTNFSSGNKVPISLMACTQLTVKLT